MSRAILTGLLLLVLLAPRAFSMENSARGLHETGLDASTKISDQPLATEQIWSIDPQELNPHLRRWILERNVSLAGLRATRRKDGNFDASAEKVVARTVIHVRGPGPWYRPMTDFPCAQERSDRFATREGSGVAAQTAADAWQDELDQDRIKLTVLLSHVSEPSPGDALLRAELIFHDWLKSTEAEWRVRAREKARVAEWRSYLEQASKQNLCTPARKAALKSAPQPSWQQMMEPPDFAHPIGLDSLLARAPARRWDGLFSVRVNVSIADLTLDGQFLIDSGSAMSVLSPSWLLSQGVNPALIEIPGTHPERISYAGGTGIARRVNVDSLQVSGLRVPIQNFLMMEASELFGPPENKGSCCDGILGADFLRQYAVEFSPGPPAEVRIWKRAGYHRDPDDPWIETQTSSSVGTFSDCTASPENASYRTTVPGTRWDTGSEMALDFHKPWQKTARALPNSWRLECDGEVIAHNIGASFPPPDESGEGSPFTLKFPGTNSGMALLARGPFTFDLGHGRLWFSKDALAKPVLVNRSGLELEFVDRDGERTLVVDSIDRKGPARALAKAGLKRGDVIARLDSVAAGDLDSWQVEQRLAGAYGRSVSVEWKSRKGPKLARLQLP